MSPAPVRGSTVARGRFPHIWGYWLGAAMIVGGIVGGLVMIVVGVNGLVQDVNDLRRTASAEGLEASLERGAEIFVYDEEFDAGPFDVTVVRTSDDAVIATERVDDGPSYDVDGRRGTARASFNVPTSDIYRIEVDTSVGEIVSFAVGGDVGSSRTSRIIQGVVIGSVVALLGFLVIVWTSIMHARFRIRGAVLQSVDTARDAVQETADAVGPEALAEQSDAAATQATSWAQQRVADARARLDRAGAGGSGVQQRAADVARSRLDQVDEILGQTSETLSEAAGNVDAPVDVAGRIDEALARIQERVQAGDSLRDIARDERAAAELAAREIQEQAAAARQQSAEQLADIEAAATSAARTELDAAVEDVRTIAGTAVDDIGTQVTDAGDELTAGIVATAGAAAAAAATSAQARVDSLGFPIEDEQEATAASTLPPPPGSTLPPPPGGTPPPPPPPPGAEALPPPPAPTSMVPEPVAESEAGPDPEPVLPPGEEAAPVVEVVEVVAAPEPGPASPAEVAATSVAPPSDPGFLAPPPAATVRGPQTRPGERSPEAPTEFRALAPPPLHGGILAPPPPVRPLASVPTRSDTGAELRNAPSARSSGPVPAEPDADGGDDELPAKAFSLAPPPAYRSLQD